MVDPFFPGLAAKGVPGAEVDSFRRLVLRNSGGDHHETLYRDALTQELVRDWPIDTQANRPVVHFINGEYWGIINVRERFDRFYVASHYDPQPRYRSDRRHGRRERPAELPVDGSVCGRQ